MLQLVSVGADRDDAFRHKSMLDYFQRSGFSEAFEALKKDANQESFTVDAKARYVGLLEKKWTGVVRLQKRVSE